MRFLILSVIASAFVSFLSASIAEASTKWIKAGADSSGGGKSVVCREGGAPNGRINSIAMLDLYEARAMYGLELAGDGRSLDEHLEAVKAKLLYATPIGEYLLGGISRLRSKLRILPPGTRIEPVDDASPIALPEGCRLEQAAVWVDRGLVVADHEHWHAMDERNRAALIAHEVVYDATRKWGGEKNSRRARKIVAHAFATFEFGDYRGVTPNESSICLSNANNPRNYLSFTAFADPSGRLVARIESLDGRMLFGKNFARFPSLKYREDSPVVKWDVAEIDSNFETENSVVLKWDPAKPAGERLSAVLLDEQGRRYDLPLVCFGLKIEPSTSAERTRR